MKRIKVLHIAEIDNDMAKGTSTIIPQYVIQQQCNKNFEVYFLNCNKIKLTCSCKIKNIYTPIDNKKNDVIASIQPDLVIFHELYKVPYLKIYKYLVNKRVPYIIIPHGGMTKKAQSTKRIKKKLGNLLLFNSFFNKAKAVQYLSENEKSNTNFTKLNYFILGNGISNIPSKNLYFQKKDKEKEFLNFIYVGRYDYLIKGIDQLLEAFFIAKQKKLKVKLLMYGKGNEKDYLLIKNYIKNNYLDDYIILNGPIYNEEKRKTILKNDVFIQVSRTEGQPLGVMEAMSLGMPVLLSEGTGYADIINKYKIGNQCKTDKYDIYDKIKNIANNRQKLKKMSENSYLYAIENYSWNEILKKSYKVYLDITKKEK